MSGNNKPSSIPPAGSSVVNSNGVNNTATTTSRRRKRPSQRNSGVRGYLAGISAPAVHNGAGRTLHVAASQNASPVESTHTKQTSMDFSQVDTAQLFSYLSELKKQCAENGLDISPFIEQLDGKNPKEIYTHTDGRVKELESQLQQMHVDGRAKELESQIQQMHKENEFKAKSNELHAERHHIKLEELKQKIAHEKEIIAMNQFKAFMEMMVSASKTVVDLAKMS